MGLLINKDDRSGGFMIVSVSDGTHSHRMRFHIPEFANAPGAPTAAIPLDRGYAGTAPAGFEATVGETFYELAVCLRGMYNTNYQFRLAALYTNSATGARQGAPGPGGGNLTPVYPVPRPIAVIGTSGGNNGWLPGQVTLSFNTLLGGRFSLRMISSEEWDPQGKKSVVIPNTGTGSTPITITTAYLEGQLSGVSATGNPGIGGASFGYTTGAAHTMICGHDGSALYAPGVKTNCMNHRYRRTLKVT